MICGKIDVKRSVGKYQNTCEDILENISKCAKIFDQISEDVQKMFWQISADLQRYMSKYQKTRKELWATISSGAKICGPISADPQRSKGKYQQTSKNLLWSNISKRAKICFGQISAEKPRFVCKYQ